MTSKAKKTRPPEWAHARAEQRRLKRAAIVQAASGTLHEKGYHKTSLRDIAHQLGMTDGALYYYFRNKAELASESILAGHQQSAIWLDEAARHNGTGLEKVEIFTREIAEALFAQKIWVPSTEPFWLAVSLKKKIREAAQENLEKLAALIREGMEDRSIGPCDPMVTAAMIAGFLFFVRGWMPAAPIFGGNPASVSKIAMQFIARSLAQGAPLPSPAEIAPETKAQL